MDKGPLAAFPVINCEIFLQDGKYHDVDSSDMAFRIASRQAMRQAISKADAVILEPFMQVQVETPDEFQGFVIGDLSSRRGLIQGTEAAAVTVVVIVETSVPQIPVFRADRPFVFVIHDNKTKSILFMGKVVDPS